MFRSFLIGLVAGQRGIAPLAAIAVATFRKKIPAELPLQELLLDPMIVAVTVALAAAEMAGDKMKTAPDRIVPIGLAVRSVTAACAGAALAPRDERFLGAAVGVGTALASSYIGWRLRCVAMDRYGQTATGLIEDAIVIGSDLAIIDSSSSKGNALSLLMPRRQPRTGSIQFDARKNPLPHWVCSGGKLISTAWCSSKTI